MFTEIPNVDSIAAILPDYTSTGDSTRILFINGSQIITQRRISTVLNQLARSLAKDLTALKQNASQATASSIFQPLALTPGLVLCPLKVRLPRVAGDTSIGYINLHALMGVTENQQKPYQSMIKLLGGAELPVLWKASTVKKHFQQGKLATLCTAHNSILPPALTLIAQKQVAIMYDLLLFQHQSLQHPPDRNFLSLLP